MTREYVVSVSVFSSDETAVARAAEVLARAVVGLALDGTHVTLNIGPQDDDG